MNATTDEQEARYVDAMHGAEPAEDDLDGLLGAVEEIVSNARMLACLGRKGSKWHALALEQAQKASDLLGSVL